MMRHVAIVAVLCLAGCSAGTGKPPIPRIDASSDEALDASIERINSQLSDTKKKEFVLDCSTVTEPERVKTDYRVTLDRSNGKPRIRAQHFKVIDRKTADEVHDLAEEYRTRDAKLSADMEAVHAQNTRLAMTSDPIAISIAARLAMKKAVEEQFGAEKVRQSDVTAEAQDVKDLGDDAWEVTGLYRGPDREGVDLEFPMTARVEWAKGKLQCPLVKLGERKVTAPPVPPVVSRSPISSPPTPAGAGTTPAGRGMAGDQTSKKTSRKRVKETAAGALERAKAAEDAGQSTKAQGIYQEIVNTYPDTEEATKAQDAVDRLMGKHKKKRMPSR